MRERRRCCAGTVPSGFDFKVNVNLSVVQLLQADVVETVERTIEETGIEPRNLTLEVTESLAINDMERMQGILNRIRALGVKIALDDFGTGYSSLNHIREIPFDMIKVVQSLGGIETESQYRIVRKMKVKYIQGYYFDRPMQREVFEEKYCRHVSK